MKVYQVVDGKIDKREVMDADMVIWNGHIMKDREGNNYGKQIGDILVVFEEIRL